MRSSLPLSLVCFRSLAPSRFHFPASLRSTVITRFTAIMDALTSAGQLFGPLGHEHRPVPVRKFTAYPDTVSCHSVSKHRPCAPGLFVVTFVLSAHSAGLSHHHPMISYSELGPPRKISRLASTLIRHNPPNRVYRRSRLTPCITDWQFASSCSPRSAFAAAVTFRYRPVDFGLTGTLTPLRHRLHSRTSQTRSVWWGGE